MTDIARIQRGAAPLVDADVLAAIRDIPLKQWLIDSTPHCIAETAQAEFIDRAAIWFTASTLNKIDGFEHWPFRRMTAGVTQSIEDFLWRNRHRNLRVLPGEYPYAMRLWGDCEDCFARTPDALRAGDALVLSVPFAATGALHAGTNDYIQQAARLSIPVLVDCAYYGACEAVRFTAEPPVESVCFSLSKTFASGSFRVGLEFSRVDNGGAALQNQWNYGPNLAATIGVHLMEKFDADFLVRKYKKVQTAICQKLCLAPSQTLFFGLARTGWDQFSRDGEIQRCGISQLIRDEYDKLVSARTL
jgi:hypothetical protein